jgi:two-component system, chemotaxis family, sensor kinase CheA
MNISDDISQEELTVFLEETDEEIKLLDEDLVLLEKNGVTPESIQKIFRAAHTLKGSSGMLGYEKMSRVAHAMENVLDKLRSHTLDINTPIANALLDGLDMLKLLREKLVSNEDSATVDVTAVIADLEKVNFGVSSEKKAAENPDIKPNESAQPSLQPVQALGENTCKIKVAFDKNSSWLAVRHFQLITELSQIGQIVHSSPTKEEVESGKIGPKMELVFISSRESEAINKTIRGLQEVQSVEITFNDKTEADSSASASRAPTAEVNKNKEPAVQNTAKAAQTSETVRIDVKLLDNLINLIGEMVIERNRIKQLSKNLDTKYEDDEIVSTLNDASNHMASLVSQMQENILRARMLQIGTILSGFPRLVRDLAQKANKKIDLIIEGSDTELDRSIIEQIKDPLLHIIRNSVDHGIEKPEIRQKNGKNERGTIRLKAYHEQSHIVVCISDDGGGIDTEKVKESAVRKNFISAEAVSSLSVEEAHNLIFLNGLSTAEKVSEVSGRGVGMDVVKTNISNIGGSIMVDSKIGQGTNIKLRLPLTLATIDGILISSGGLIYVIPISVIVEILRLKSDQISNVMGKEVFRLRENVINLVRLSQRFEEGQKEISQAEETNIVVIKVGDKLTGLVVDTVMEPQESVVKPLGKFIGSVKGVSGATIMGDGTVALILDAATLVKES